MIDVISESEITSNKIKSHKRFKIIHQKKIKNTFKSEEKVSSGEIGSKMPNVSPAGMTAILETTSLEEILGRKAPL